MKRIDDLAGGAFEEAIKNVANIINRRMGTSFSYKEDWDALEHLANDFDLMFNENGELA